MDVGSSIGLGQVAEFERRKISGLKVAFETLLDAAQCAQSTQMQRWEYAVPISEMGNLGLSPNDLRWMINKRWLCHGRDLTQLRDCERKLEATEAVIFDDRSCFVLSDDGIVLAASSFSSSFSTVKSAPHSVVPSWKSDRSELWFGEVVVKRFRWAAVNQETILATFEEDGWPARIDDPLPYATAQDPKRRLGDTIKCLNRNQCAPIMRFRGDGTGEGVRWDLQAMQSEFNSLSVEPEPAVG